MLVILAFLEYLGLSPIPLVAYLIGTTEPALKLLISIFVSYPMAMIYHNNVRKEDHETRHFFFILMGLDMAIYNFGISLYHNIIPAIVFYTSTKILGHSKENAILTLVFNMTYLIIGYMVTESEDYDITWTMPQCVLTLKLIALSFDLLDGRKKYEELSLNTRQTAIMEAPTVVELLGFIYFPPCFLVGPIFSFKRYKQFIYDSYPLDSAKDVYERYAFRRLLQGIGYLIAFQVGVTVFSPEYMMTDEFAETSIFYRHFYCGLWGHFALYKYISCWLLTEAACIRFGFSYNGTESSGEHSKTKWDGCTNIKLMRFEGATRFQHYIDSFNCNTNYFAAEYVYKRLKFLGNRSLSQVLTLFFLALWHGTQSGYYATFFNEFIIMIMEKDFEKMVTRTKIYYMAWSHPIAKYILYGILKMYTIVFMGWCLVPITLKTFPRWWLVYQRLWFSGFLFFLPWAFVYKPLVKSLISRFFSEPAKAG